MCGLKPDLKPIQAQYPHHSRSSMDGSKGGEGPAATVVIQASKRREKEKEKEWMNKGEKGEVVQKIVWIYSEAKSYLLDDLACSILPLVSGIIIHRLTFLVLLLGMRYFKSHLYAWRRRLLELMERFLRLRKLSTVKSRVGSDPAFVEKNLIQIQKSVDAVTVHAMAANYGGKSRRFERQQEQIQTLCSEAKVKEGCEEKINKDKV
ncbi:hypothetical protein Tsubulata_003892 [Turnera subulata]|uniref:Uncharacterized protein n=1 Tax=Turnera subulata TaxID=218843 RepID=A0A9Q0JRQ1_9ROSI|nr:hypothetical protein Tsubulata_003892 [Turnera subulata]